MGDRQYSRLNGGVHDVDNGSHSACVYQAMLERLRMIRNDESFRFMLTDDAGIVMACAVSRW